MSDMMLLGVGGGGAAPPAGPTHVQSVGYSDQTFDTAQNLNIPAGVVSGNTLIAAFMMPSGLTITPPSGWTLTGERDNTVSHMRVYEKTADGTEGSTTVNWSTNAAGKSSFVFYEVDAPTGQVEVDFADAVDPPSHTPTGGSAATVWIAVSASLRNNATVSAAPTGYSGLIEEGSTPTPSASTAENQIAGAYKESTAASDDPATFTWSGSLNPIAATISVR